MRQVFAKALNKVGQRKTRKAEGLDRKDETVDQEKQKAPASDWDMSPEDALRVGTVANYK
ncbi:MULTISPECIES: hypothetical protein [Marinobacter]|uniref:hypothetical protein n=1 Tax=Marinobacter TaxID=2742 RepID=UPI001D06CC55|nr:MULTISPECIES: hypothetical protein [Marinobacter]MCG8516707.1 hypothetical protein [Pseudomonadales bacterium]MCK7566601.1 hypothetical protein [Marinobacter xestospongiae]UDL06721.1 hypothetical protein J2887_08215 [Marinobacter sp. CA1]